MLNRSILIIIVIASLSWISYTAFQILQDKNNFAPESLFGIEDESILIVNRPNEFNLSVTPDFQSSPTADLFKSTNDSAYVRCYISLKKDHILFVKNDGWENADISALFQQNKKVEIDNGEFQIKGYHGKFHLKNLYLSRETELPKNNTQPFIYDKKSTASLISLNPVKGIYSTTDIYFNEDGIANFITKNDELIGGKKRSDEMLFSGILSKKINSYHFYERDYLQQFDSVFANGPLFQWVDAGFVEVNYEGNTALISDYIAGQDPFWVLDEFSKTMDTTWYNVPLTKNFPKNNKRYKVEYLEDFVVISTSEETCKKIISDYKLGQTIALSDLARSTYYSQLPKMVSERFVDKNNTLSRSVYKGKLMESNASVMTIEKPESRRESFSISLGADIHDFYSLRNDGDVVVLTKDGTIQMFKSGKLTWKTKTNGKLISPIQLIDLHATGEEQILVNTSEEIHLLDLTGKEVNGFPVKMEQDAVGETKFYRWREKSYFLVALSNNTILHLDAKGREINIIRNKHQVSNNIDVWASQKKLFAGFSHEGQFTMYDLDNNKVHREFIIPIASTTIKVPNELFHFGIKNNQLIKVDQKGLEFDMGGTLATKVFAIENTKISSIGIQNNNEIKLLNINGIPYAEIRLPFNEIDGISIFNTDSGKTYVGVIDGLENNVYLYTADGQLLTSKGLEGQRKMSIQSSGKSYRITTIVDQYIVQYFEN